MMRVKVVLCDNRVFMKLQPSPLLFRVEWWAITIQPLNNDAACPEVVPLLLLCLCPVCPSVISSRQLHGPIPT